MPKFQVKAWDRSNFPSLYRSADDVARQSQKLYISWIAGNLFLLVFGAAAAAFEKWPFGQTTARIAAAVAFFLGLGVSLLLAHQRWDRKWYAGRAVAESVKSLAWKYSTGAEPFPHSLSEQEATARLTSQLKELVNEHRWLAPDLAASDELGSQVTEWMTGLRSSAVGVRRDVYLQQRVEDQRAWYAGKTRWNLRKQRGWFLAFVGAQIAAGAAMLYEAEEPTTEMRLGGLLGAMAAAVLAWSQIKRYQELAQSYGLAAQELAMVGSRAPHVLTEDELSRFVADAETAISREHTGWIARRETA